MSPEFQHHLLYEFSTLIVVLDPIATTPVFMAVTSDLNRRDTMRVAFYSLALAFSILLFFIIFGQIFLEALNIPMASFQLAGSIILFLLGLDMLKGKIADSARGGVNGFTHMQRAAYPLAMPVIAGAGSILTVVLLTDNHTRSVGEQIQTAFLLLICLCIHFISFFFSAYIKKYLGMTGIETVSRVFGLILTSIAVTGIVVAIKISFGLPN